MTNTEKFSSLLTDAGRVEFVKTLPEKEKMEILEEVLTLPDYADDDARLLAFTKNFDAEYRKEFEDLKKEFYAEDKKDEGKDKK